MDKEGFLFFFKFKNGDLNFRRLVKFNVSPTHEHLRLITDVNFETMEESDKRYAFLDFEEMLFIPPPSGYSKNIYEIGDDVYFYNGFCLRLGKIRNFGTDGSYFIDTPYKTYIRHTLIPYNWPLLYERCRMAILEWAKCGLRIVYKDVRILIGKYIWTTRNEYVWMCNHKHTRKRLAHKRIKNYA